MNSLRFLMIHDDSHGRLEASHRKPNNTASSTPYPFDAQPFLAMSAGIDHMSPPGNTDAAKKHISLQRLHCSSLANLLCKSTSNTHQTNQKPSSHAQKHRSDGVDRLKRTPFCEEICAYLCPNCHGNHGGLRKSPVNSAPVARSVASQAAGSS